MFKSIKRKIISFLMVVGALTQTVKASEPVKQETAEQKTVMNATAQKNTQQIPFLPIDWKVGGSIGLLALGALTAVGVSRSSKFLDSDEHYFRKALDGAFPDTPAPIPSQPVQAKAPVSVQAQPQSVQPTSASEKPAFDPLAIRPITPEQDMSSDERALLATRLRAVRTMEDINRERAKLTRQMAKAKREHDEYTINLIIAQRSALSRLRKDAFAQAVGPLYDKIKEERRMLSKQMALARRRQDNALKQEITRRRAMLKEEEKLATFSVRSFKYKQERAKFIKRKPANPTVVAFTQKEYQRAA